MRGASLRCGVGSLTHWLWPYFPGSPLGWAAGWWLHRCQIPGRYPAHMQCASALGPECFTWLHLASQSWLHVCPRWPAAGLHSIPLGHLEWICSVCRSSALTLKGCGTWSSCNNLESHQNLPSRSMAIITRKLTEEKQWDVLNLGTHVRNAMIFSLLHGFKADYWNTVPYFTVYRVIA